ncbi:DUF4328 domain-containing protein [Ciceribacter sp. L1K23]|uniref:DUF4328 domain-containing protein n=1 Tax=Ciceribacter sp. L1K23 TaxID=2820276 RepID=UPI001B843D21|nr:DUF4328 domain-containing protein [Ciceribacter sp. L1K23]MBR0556774.1 DUF4328 domain-containing protein [Ciceribacter sp. L1K23]
MPLERLRRRLRIAVLFWRLSAVVTGILLVIGGAGALYLSALNHQLAIGSWIERALFDRGPVAAIVVWLPLFDLCLIGLSIFTIYFWLRWIAVAVRAARSVESGSVRYSPAVAVLGFLVPVVNLWMPLYTLLDLEHFAASVNGEKASPFVVRPTMVVLLGLLALGLIRSVGLHAVDDFSMPEEGRWMMLGVALAAIMALILLMVLASIMSDFNRAADRVLVDGPEASVLTHDFGTASG